MEKGRNSSGQFVKGHSGFKPKGAASKKQAKREQLLDYILATLGTSVVESLPSMPPNKVMRLYVQLLKLTVPKMARIPYVPEKQVSKPHKVKFEIKNQA
jgi:hypothetical protein